MKKLIAAALVMATLSSCTVSWTIGADGSESFNASIIPIPVEDCKK